MPAGHGEMRDGAWCSTFNESAARTWLNLDQLLPTWEMSWVITLFHCASVSSGGLAAAWMGAQLMVCVASSGLVTGVDSAVRLKLPRSVALTMILIDS